MVELPKTAFPIRKYGFIQLPGLESNMDSKSSNNLIYLKQALFFFSSTMKSLAPAR